MNLLNERIELNPVIAAILFRHANVLSMVKTNHTEAGVDKQKLLVIYANLSYDVKVGNDEVPKRDSRYPEGRPILLMRGIPYFKASAGDSPKDIGTNFASWSADGSRLNVVGISIDGFSMVLWNTELLQTMLNGSFPLMRSFSPPVWPYPNTSGRLCIANMQAKPVCNGPNFSSGMRCAWKTFVRIVQCSIL